MKVTAPEGATVDDAINYAAQTYEPIQPDTTSGDFMSGIKAGSENLFNLVTKAGKAQVQEILGFEESAEESYRDFLKATRDTQQRYPKAIQTFAEATDNPQDFLDFTQRGLGEALPSTLPSVVVGLGTGLLTANPFVGAAAAYGTSLLQTSPENFANFMEAGDIENEAVKGLATGSLTAGLDLLTPVKLLNKMFGKAGSQVVAQKLLSKAGMKQASKDVSKQAAETFALEGFTEMGQETISTAAEEILSEMPEEMFTKENIGRIAQAGYFGGLAGGVIGGAGQTVSEFTRPRSDLSDPLSFEEEILEAATNPNKEFERVSREVLSEPSAPLVTNFDPFNSSLDDKVKFQKLTTPMGGFTSKLENIIKEKLPGKGTGRTYQDIVNAWQKKGLFTKEELEFTGLKEFLEDQEGQVDASTVSNFLTDNMPKLVSNITTTETSAPQPRTYPDLTLEKGLSNNYREFTINLPKTAVEENTYYDEHFNRPNTISSIRTTDKVIDGKNTLFVEEVQSDLHQTGRRFGYMPQEEFLMYNHITPAELERRRTNGFEESSLPEGVTPVVPDLPFKKNWEDLSIKKMLQTASQEGKEQIAFPLGEAAARIQGHMDETTIGKFYNEVLPKKLRKVAKELGLQEPQKTTLTYGGENKSQKLNEDKLTRVINEAVPEQVGLELAEERLAGRLNDIEDLRVQLMVQGFSGPDIQPLVDFVTEPEQITVDILTVPLNNKDRTRILNGGIPLFQQIQNAVENPYNTPGRTFTQVSKQLKVADLSPEQKTKYKDKIKLLKKDIRNILGNQANVEFVDNIIFDEQGTTDSLIRGAQFMDTVFVSLGVNERAGTQEYETALHEAWHFLETNKAFSKPELKMLEKGTDKIVDLILEDGNNTLLPADIDFLKRTPEGREELRATAFGLFANRWAKEGKPMKKIHRKLPREADNVFKKGIQALRRLGDAIRNRLGWRAPEDVFVDVLAGSKAVNQVVHENRTVKLQELFAHTKGLEDSYKGSFEVFDKENVEKSLKEAVDSQNEMAPMGLFTKVLGSTRNIAIHNPAFAPVYGLEESKMNRQNEYLTNYRRTMRDFESLDKQSRENLYDLGEFLRNTNQKSKLDEEGNLVFKRNGKTVRLKDKTTSRIYSGLQRAYGMVIRDAERIYKRDTALALGADPESLNTTTLESMRTDENTEQIDSILEQLTAFNKMKNKDFVPYMRFGQWGIVVRDLEDTGEDGKPKMVEFRKFDSGRYKKKLNKHQMEEAFKDFNEKYGNNPRYAIFGDKGQKLSLNSLDSFAKPFLVNNARKYENLPSDIEGIDTLFDLIASEGVDTEVFTDVYNRVMGRVQKEKTEKGFKKRFMKSDDIPGYSKDWDRVHSAYFHGASHFFSNLDYAPQEATIRTSLNDVADPKIRQLAEDFLDYNRSPVEDMIKLRTFNFMWALGFNASTAALQTMTLPTTTLASQSRFNSNPISNMARIGKWMKLGRHLMTSGSEFQDGALIINFDNKDGWEKIRKEAKMSKEDMEMFRKFIERQDIRNTIGGLFVGEYVGQQVYETRDSAAKTRNLMTKAGQTAGLMISGMEQYTRFVTFMSSMDLFLNNASAKQRATDLYSNNALFQEQQKANPDMEIEELLALNVMDDAHAVFGKRGRPQFMKSWGGSLFFPFMTYPHQMLELMWNMAKNQGRDGKIGFGVAVGTFFLFSGLLGLPGGELLKELYEEVHKTLAGENIDLDMEIRDTIYEMTGSTDLGLMATQGTLRAFGNMDVARRIGLPIPGQEILMSLLGIRGDSSDLVGVSGSVLQGVGEAIKEYNVNQGPSWGMLSASLPIAASNLTKAIQYQNEGVTTKRGTLLVKPEEVTPGMSFLRAFGVNHGKIATMREFQFYTQTLENRHQPAYENFRERAKRSLTKYYRATQQKNYKKAEDFHLEYQGVLEELKDWAIENDYPLPYLSFTRSVMDAVNQRLYPEVHPIEVRKSAQKDLPHLKKVLGIENIR